MDSWMSGKHISIPGFESSQRWWQKLARSWHVRRCNQCSAIINSDQEFDSSLEKSFESYIGSQHLDPNLMNQIQRDIGTQSPPLKNRSMKRLAFPAIAVSATIIIAIVLALNNFATPQALYPIIPESYEAELSVHQMGADVASGNIRFISDQDWEMSLRPNEEVRDKFAAVSLASDLTISFDGKSKRVNLLQPQTYLSGTVIDAPFISELLKQDLVFVRIIDFAGSKANIYHPNVDNNIDLNPEIIVANNSVIAVRLTYADSLGEATTLLIQIKSPNQ